MLTILEIALVAAAWRRGWRWWALLAPAALLAVAFLTGFAIGLSGGNIEPVTPFFLLLEVICIVVLAMLAARAPRREAAVEVRERGVLTNATLESS